MSRLGTDVMAWACIVGGAAVGGVATMSMAEDRHDARHVECAVVGEVGERIKTSQVVVALGGPERVIISTPDVSVHRHRPHCVTLDESIEWTEAREFEIQGAKLRMEQARAQLEMARQMELDVLDLEGLDLRLEGIGFELDLGKEISDEIGRSLAEEMSRLEEELRRLEEIGR